jgi:hypothetical protein
MRITIDIPQSQEEAVLDAFADPGENGRSEAVVVRKILEGIAATITQQGEIDLARTGRDATLTAIANHRAAMAAEFGLDRIPGPPPGGPPGGPPGNRGRR